ncbi:hypothetical protein DRF60_14425 [Chryseobacterium elymi]|uniref:Uncharacterized protein n=1 Tax=Chryseobacterium elymi TaxID=395936 RepID=A0A3D9DDN0_9FLAO|nr:hypothetical protein [Chryseobacterium elymi]REC76076.1 hypothetical protein DRF60_14425 [Chryseobacterium elymi]
MKTKVQEKSNERKLNNVSFEALRDIELLEERRLSWGLINFNSVLNHFNWGFYRDRNKYPDFHSLGSSMSDHARKGNIGKYQIYCLVKLSSIIYDARVLYENNLIDFTQLHSIVVRVRNDAHKRFKSIEKTQAKKELKNKKLNSDSLLILKAKLAILENED